MLLSNPASPPSQKKPILWIEKEIYEASKEAAEKRKSEIIELTKDYFVNSPKTDEQKPE